MRGKDDRAFAADEVVLQCPSDLNDDIQFAL